MNKTLLCFFILTIGTFQQLNAQLEKVLYKSFSIEDSTDNFQIQITDPYEIITWSGTNVMVETTVKFSGASIDLLQAVIRDGRYSTLSENHLPTKILKNNPRWVLKNNSTGKDVVEIVTHRLYIPEEFKVVSNSHMSRREDITADNRSKVESAFQSAVLFNDEDKSKNSKKIAIKQ